jgi:hypothetical protein
LNQSSDRASPGGSSALSRHCSRRWVWVNVPSFSMCVAAGRRNTSVWMSSVRISPLRTSGPSFQNRALSISPKSRTTSHLSFDIARRCRPACIDPAAGFWPMRKNPSTPPSSIRSIVAKWACTPVSRGR